VARLIREIFELESVMLFDAHAAALHCCGCAEAEPIAVDTRKAYLTDSDTFNPDTRSWFCVLRLGVRPVGAMALCGTDMSALTATALASLAAIALERARTIENQSRAEAGRQAEQLRTAVLDALAHQFKTPLTVIRTAGSGLPAAGELSPLQTELVSLIDQEARKLNDLASRLLGAPAIDAQEFAPQPEPLLFSRLLRAAIQELENPAERDRFRIATPAQEPPVFADR
jgi:two-component system sensor histidine kinase KdpD